MIKFITLLELHTYKLILKFSFKNYLDFVTVGKFSYALTRPHVASHRLERTSDGGNGNHSVSLPIILIKIKVDQMLPSSYI